MVDCKKCINKGQTNGLSQESFCSSCIHSTSWMKDYYNEGARGGKPHNNCDGCARGLPVVNGLHMDNGMAICGCTAHLYA